jgi:AMP-polyphosphate phosphotransferase
MFARTSTKTARWHAIAGEHKWFARVAALETAVKVLGEGLDLTPLPVDKSVEETARKLLGQRELTVLGFGARKAK